MKRYLPGALLMLTVWAAPARADWLFTPSIGSTFGADSNGNVTRTVGAGPVAGQ